ncbi:MAG: nitroreductase family protein [Pseudomonadota bacterium]
MELLEAIEKRRTIRIFEKPAVEEQLRRIILAGTKAPSAVNRQPWAFIIIDDRELIERLADLKYRLNRKEDPQRPEKDAAVREKKALFQKESFRNASVVAVCHETGWERSVWLCIENMSLVALEEGLGSGIVLLWDDEKEEAEKLMGLTRGYELTALMKFGVPGEEGHARDRNPAGPRRPEFSWLHKNRF